MSQNEEVEYERFRIIEGLLRELVFNTARPVAPPESEQPAPVFCPNCERVVSHIDDHYQRGSVNGREIIAPGYGCALHEPAPVAAGEMPNAVLCAVQRLRSSAYPSDSVYGDALELWWRSQPVARVEMTEAASVGKWQLEDLLKYANLAEVSLRTGFAPPDFLGVDLPYLLRRAIAAVRAQTTAPKKLEKVRGLVRSLWECVHDQRMSFKVDAFENQIEAARLELDTYERGGREGGR